MRLLPALAVALALLAPHGVSAQSDPPPPPPAAPPGAYPAPYPYAPPGAYPPPGGYPPPYPPGAYAYPPGAYGQPPPPPRPRAEPEDPPEFKSVAVEANPLALFISRYSVNIEWLPAMHHGLIFNPHYVDVNADFIVVNTETGARARVEDSFSGFGAELGYRFYTGKKGPNGFFVGPSLLAGFYSTGGSDITGAGDRDFSSYGWALDFGGQAVVGPGVVIGGGGGFQYTWVGDDVDDFEDLPLSAWALVGGGFRPRALFSIGFAF